MMGLRARWGTWEELILGGAVLRHGTDAWEAVAAELRARTPNPNLFTPKECQAKYEHIQEQYSGCNAWFEELRKQRVAELKRDLEKSDDSIGNDKCRECWYKMKPLPYMIFLSTVMLFIIYRMATIQYEETEMEAVYHPFDMIMDSGTTGPRIGYLPHGIVHAKSDLEVKPLWVTKSSKLKEIQHRNLLAMSVGIKQKNNVDIIVRKFFSENFTVVLFHYDGNVNGWNDFWWSNKVIHIAANDQTKWWFAKRFLYPDVVSIYNYIFLWDEDLGVDNFHPGRYLKIVKSEGLEISQPALDPNLSEIHHRLTVRRKKGKVHRRLYDSRSRRKCTKASEGPPCAGWVEGMAPVFSRSAWRCAWHLIQNDLIHGWGMDMKLGYCAQGDRTQKVGVVDSEFVVHQGVQTLGGSSKQQKHRRGTLDARTEVRRQARAELESFQERWDRATREDGGWVDPFLHHHHERKDKKHALSL